MIDYGLIAAALDYYKFCGFKEIDVPWTVSREITEMTKPVACKAFKTDLGDLVGSGEQGFMQMMKDGKLRDGRYVCCTPCFRDEINLNKFKKNYFLKVELICVGNGVRESDML